MTIIKCPFCSAACLGVEATISHTIYHHFLAEYAERKFVMDHTLEFYVVRQPDDAAEFHKMIAVINALRNYQPSVKAGILFDDSHNVMYSPYTNTVYPVQLMCYNVENCLLASVLHAHLSETIAGIPEFFDTLHRKVKREVNHLIQGLDKGTHSWNS